MAYDVSALSNYTKEQEAALVTKSLFSAKTASLIKAGGVVLTGVKSSEKIPILETDVVFQTGGTCGFNAQGTTTLSDRQVTVGKIKVNEALCPKNLEAKATQKKLSLGSSYEEIAFAQEYAEQKAGKSAEALETADWQGDTNSGNANLNKYDGLIKIIDAVASSVTHTNAKTGTGTITNTTGSATVTGTGTAFDTQVAVGDKIVAGGAVVGTVTAVGSATSLTVAANPGAANTGAAFTIVPAAAFHFAAPILSATGIADSNVRSIVNGMWRKLPAKLKNKPDLRIFCGWDVFESFVAALTDANLFHYTASQADGELTIPGTQYKLIAVNGLNGTNRLYSIRLSNMALGTDLENEEEEFEIFFAKEADEIRYKAEFKRGVNVIRPDEIVSFKLA